MQTRPQSQWILLVALTALALYLCWSILRPFLPVLLWATVLVIVFHPAYRWWRQRLGNASLAALTTTLLVIVTIIVPLVAVSSAVIAQLQGVASAAQDQVTGLLGDPAQAARLQEALGWVTHYTGIDVAGLRQGLQQAATALSQLLVQGTMSVLGGALGFIVSTFFVMFTMYYLFKDGEAAVEVVQSMLPLERAQSDALVQRTGEIVSASVFGVVVIAVVQGTLGGLTFWVLGLPSPLVWGVVMIVLSTIPMLGTFLVWVPAAVFLAVTGHLGEGAGADVLGGRGHRHGRQPVAPAARGRSGPDARVADLLLSAGRAAGLRRARDPAGARGRRHRIVAARGVSGGRHRHRPRNRCLHGAGQRRQRLAWTGERVRRARGGSRPRRRRPPIGA